MTTDDQTRDALTRLLELERQPVALRWSTSIPKDIPKAANRARFCVRLDQASRGNCFYTTAEEEECMGGARYCGMRDTREFPTGRRSGEFLVARGVYENVAAVQRAWRQNLSVEPGIFKALMFAPLPTAPFDPDVVFVLCNARQGMQLLHANAYDSGARGIGADAGPICSSMAAVPYLTGKVSYGFGDVGSRGYMNLGAEGVMVSLPGCELTRVVANLEKMKNKKAFARHSPAAAATSNRRARTRYGGDCGSRVAPERRRAYSSKVSENCSRRGGCAETAWPKNGELRLPT